MYGPVYGCLAAGLTYVSCLHAGKYVDLPNTISGFKGVLDGKYDDIPEMAFYMVRQSGCC